MGKIVAIGGGELSLGETRQIDEYIVSLTGKANPRLLFIPTASSDAEGYIKTVEEKFGELGCTVDSLCLVSESCEDREIRDKIFSADLIYVGGGDTDLMMRVWGEYGVDNYLREAYEKDIVLSGLSAGSICWFDFGHSDSLSYRNKGQWDFIRVYGLGLIPAAHAPHYNEEGREGFDSMILEEGCIGIALEDNVALVEVDGAYEIVKADKNRKAFFLRARDAVLKKYELPEGKVTIDF
ncbi:MAG: type 1 glutamine amidotransferase-like domain-containing protein [Clostridiaceae bacterium]|nr:type 1 glutamine amidotransferase-like domain-containing protein [Clostridiaceae bacterium]